ncbi:DUF2795 domain-containing protein [Nakamurella multipartita]|uniref:DUF2795 domain-containing protein n=1 Tax=Nakamurella multipartita (strain ATCC 700099 / DSM 44233 / CIP 104796 / JCM 9543 / NBRC 105858 / Y-104) TaxID=479431 RepID=C8X649_NAKMY|nr:DUF2795 domain-containing protein [Nakamurella multipartita]ACV76820.1 hypothetical protein Namu_0394 [Nakamurella multipartita DSM 44233]
MTSAEQIDQVVDAVSMAFCMRPVTRADLLTAAVAAHAPTPVFDALLQLPERRYYDIVELRGQLRAAT